MLLHGLKSMTGNQAEMTIILEEQNDITDLAGEIGDVIQGQRPQQKQQSDAVKDDKLDNDIGEHVRDFHLQPNLSQTIPAAATERQNTSDTKQNRPAKEKERVATGKAKGNKIKAKATRRNIPPKRPELPLPDSMPTKKAKFSGPGEWAKVAARGATRNQENEPPEKQFVNASTHVVGDLRGWQAAVEVRFGMNGAKHDVKRIVPRHILE